MPGKNNKLFSDNQKRVANNKESNEFKPEIKSCFKLYSLFRPTKPINTTQAIKIQTHLALYITYFDKTQHFLDFSRGFLCYPNTEMLRLSKLYGKPY